MPETVVSGIRERPRRSRAGEAQSP